MTLLGFNCISADHSSRKRMKHGKNHKKISSHKTETRKVLGGLENLT